MIAGIESGSGRESGARVYVCRPHENPPPARCHPEVEANKRRQTKDAVKVSPTVNGSVNLGTNP